MDAGLRPALQLEIACNSLPSALAAQTAGADRVELFADLASGGTTPSWGTVRLARQQLKIPLFVLVRPRPGHFVYSTVEREVMLEDIASCRQLGCDGVVIGALTADAQVDVALCAQLVEAAGPLQVTFHRAFDLVADRQCALEAIIALGCQRVLSSGGAADALAGSATLAADRRRAAGRITVMAGAGITADNVAEVVRRSGCSELHASASTWMRSTAPAGAAALPGLEPAYQQTDASMVAGLRAALADIRSGR